MPAPSLPDLYGAYIDCLNRQDWARLGDYVGEAVEHNGRRLWLPGYRAMLVRDYEQIPDLRFDLRLLVCEPPHVAARLSFTCAPKGEFLGLAIDGRTVSFAENVFYTFTDAKIVSVWSVIDKTAIEAQLAAAGLRSRR